MQLSIGGRTTGVPGQVCGNPVFKHHYRHEGRIQRRAYSAEHEADQDRTGVDGKTAPWTMALFGAV